MRLTRPERASSSPSPIGEQLVVEEVLYEAERPVVFTTRSTAGQLLLAYVAADADDGAWYVLTACTQRLLEGLRSGRVPVRDALTSSWMWLVQEDASGKLLGIWSITEEELPEAHLPAPGTPLFPEHEAALVTRAIGEEVSLGRVPASVVAFVTDATRKAVKTLLDHQFSKPVEGRPTEEHRALYDLRVQRFAFASFEVSFAAPDEGLFPNVELRRAADDLQAGLRWAAAIHDEPLAATSDDERMAILRAALLLTPPSGGPISEVEVSGRWMERGKVRLTRSARRRVHAEIQRLATERVVKYVGRVGEVDRDNLSFILRETADGRDRKASFSEELLDDVIQALSDASLVAAAGVERSGRLYVVALGPPDPTERTAEST
jgi:hypothetical protein